MNDNQDISAILAAWQFDPAHNSRIIRATDGRELLQVRLPVGVEQYEIDGRPDGLRPHNQESVLDFQLTRLERARAAGTADSFRLTTAECSELFDEGVLYYCRYLHLFQLQDWRRTIRDTGRNLRLFDLIHDHAHRKEDRQHLEQWRPYVLRMHAVARAMLAVDEHAHDQALQILKETHEQIESLSLLDNETFQVERDRSLQALRDAAEHIEKHRPLTPLEKLHRDLRAAIEAQEFERAAVLRDKIRALEKT